MHNGMFNHRPSSGVAHCPITPSPSTVNGSCIANLQCYGEPLLTCHSALDVCAVHDAPCAPAALSALSFALKTVSCICKRRFNKLVIAALESRLDTSSDFEIHFETTCFSRCVGDLTVQPLT